MQQQKMLPSHKVFLSCLLMFFIYGFQAPSVLDQNLMLKDSSIHQFKLLFYCYYCFHDIHFVLALSGPLDSETFSFSMEPQLRQLGLPTELKKGKNALRCI